MYSAVGMFVVIGGKIVSLSFLIEPSFVVKGIVMSGGMQMNVPSIVGLVPSPTCNKISENHRS